MIKPEPNPAPISRIPNDRNLSNPKQLLVERLIEKSETCSKSLSELFGDMDKIQRNFFNQIIKP